MQPKENEKSSKRPEIGVRPPAESHDAQKPGLRSDQIAYQAAYHTAVGEALRKGVDPSRSDDNLGACLGALDGAARVLRDELNRRHDND